MQVWLIEEHHDDDYGGLWRCDPEDGIFATEEAAQTYVDEINAKRLEHWLQYPAERDYDFKQRLDRWKAENFDVPEAERTPKPEQRMRKAEDFPETERARIRAFEVQGAGPSAADVLEQTADTIRSIMSDPERVRPLVPDAETPTDFANDATWAEMIVRSIADALREKEQA